VIPIILGAIALSTGAFGANKVIKGVGDISVAKKKLPELLSSIIKEMPSWRAAHHK
jgi:hypothetical protein